MHDSLQQMSQNTPWPPHDSPATMPRACAAKHAALEVAGVDPGLVKVSLPAWRPQPLSTRTGIAYLAPCGLRHRLGVVVRVFNHLYRPADLFFYQVDQAANLKTNLTRRLASRFSGGLPSNVRIADMPYPGRVFYWGHTANAFAAIREMLLMSPDWEWLVHLHDGAYPVHAPEYMRVYLSQRRGVNFIQVDPWDKQHWQARNLGLVHSCEDWAGIVEGQFFPEAEVSANGFSWGMGSEWWVITRQVAAYLADDRLRPFLNLMQYRVNVEEIIWASILLNIPQFAELTDTKLTWDTFSCSLESCRETSHSPATLVDSAMGEYFDEFRPKLQDLFFLRTIVPSKSEGLLRWADDRISREIEYYKLYNDSGFANGLNAPLDGKAPSR